MRALIAFSMNYKCKTFTTQELNFRPMSIRRLYLIVNIFTLIGTSLI